MGTKACKKRIKAGLTLLKNDICCLRYALLGIAVYFVCVHFLFGQFCPLLILAHFPCPGCGMTRALFLVLTGRPAEAWRLQPLIYGWIFLGLWFAVNRYLRGKKSALLRGYLICLLLAALVLYGYRLVYGFPPGLWL